MAVDTGVPRDYSAEPARERADYFQCFVADQPEYLVPERLCSFEGKRPAGPLTVSRDAWFAWREDLPDSVAECYPLPENFWAGAGLIWVDDRATGMQRSFWAGPWFQEKLAGMTRGRTPPALSAQHAAALLAAGVLERPGDAARRATEWMAGMAKARREFTKDGFAAMPELIHPFHLGALRRYYRRMVRTGGMTLGDNCSPKRWVAYQESAAQFFHRQLTGAVSAVAGVRVKPTFAYVASYQGSADLGAHTDRLQCEYAVSLLIDYVPEPVEQSPWPLQFAGPNRTGKVWQCLGDAVLYCGTRITHWREQLAAAAVSTSMFFYFVNEGFKGSLD
jgi:hypothetical protein